MAIDLYLVIPDFQGDPAPGDAPAGQSQDSQAVVPGAPPGAAIIPIRDYDFSTDNPAEAGSASDGAGAGKVTFSPLVITKAVDKWSTALFRACSTGQHIPAAQLRVTQPDAPQATAVTGYEFQQVSISKIDATGSAGTDQPSETVTFAFGAMAITHQSANPDGTAAGPPATAGWDRVSNTADVQPQVPLT